MSHNSIVGSEPTAEEILVVDDQAIVRERWKSVLEQAEFRVRLASDGREALDEIRRSKPDLVILDLNMPNMNGDEVCRRLKESQDTESIPVIVVTASRDAENKIDSLLYGANDYLLKDELAKTRNEELVQRVRNALRLRIDNRDGNPLTGLPGNAKIEREIIRRLTARVPLAFMYVDIDNFKAFNDYYGYRRGDEAILRCAHIISAVVRRSGNRDDFVGHIGGDDFVILTTPDVADSVAEAVVEDFDLINGEFFEPEILSAGEFVVEGRTGRKETFSLMSVTIALVTDEAEPLFHPAQINDRAAELKKFGKKQKGSFIARERRNR
jgi:PleD family two-component response regulator